VEAVQEVALGDGRILAFDGRVLEIFGDWAISTYHLAGMRIHVKQLTVTTPGPNRKGHYELELVGPHKFISTYNEFQDETEWASVQPLLDALRSAGARFESG
jgi:hypothetical protein